MATNPIIQSTGSTSGAGTVGEGRKDMELGETMTLTDTVVENAGVAHLTRFLSVPPLSALTELIGNATETPSFVPDVTGSYDVEMLVDGIHRGRIIIAVPLPNIGSRMPAVNEGRGDYNEAGNLDGWHPDLVAFMRQADTLLGAGAADISVKATVADTTPGNLQSKIAAGSNISIAVLNPGADEQLEITSAGGTDADAIHDNVSGEINAVTEKASPVAADKILIEDSEDSNSKKHVQIGNLPGGGSSAAPNGTQYQESSHYFNGFNQYMQISDAGQNGVLDGMSNLTLEAWIRPTTLGVVQTVVGKMGSAANSSYYLGLDASNNIVFGVSVDGTAVATQTETPSEALVVDNWVHISASWNGTTGQTEIFVEAASEGTAASGVTGTIFDGDSPFNVAFGGNDNEYFDGYVAYVRVWNVVRTEADIFRNCLAIMRGDEAGLLAHYPVAETGDDTTANANHMLALHEGSGSPPEGTPYNPIGIVAGLLQTNGAAVLIQEAAPPTAGQVLTAIDAENAEWQTPASGSGDSSIVSSTVLGADATSITVAGLDGDADGVYDIEVQLLLPVTAGNLQMRPNGDTANLKSSVHNETSSSEHASDWRLATWTGITGYKEVAFRITLYAARTINGTTIKRRYHFDGQRDGGNFSNRQQGGGVYDDATANLTSLEIISSVASGILAGSHIIVRKLEGMSNVISSAVAAVDTTTLSVTGLDGDAHGTYEIEGDLIIDTAAINISAEPNGATANTFSVEALLDIAKAQRAGEWRLFTQTVAVGTYHYLRFRMTVWAQRTKNSVARNRSYLVHGQEAFDFDATQHNNTFQGSGTLENATANLTSLDFVSSVASGIKAGSEIIVRKVS